MHNSYTGYTQLDLLGGQVENCVIVAVAVTPPTVER